MIALHSQGIWYNSVSMTSLLPLLGHSVHPYIQTDVQLSWAGVQTHNLQISRPEPQLLSHHCPSLSFWHMVYYAYNQFIWYVPFLQCVTFVTTYYILLCSFIEFYFSYRIMLSSYWIIHLEDEHLSNKLRL